MRICFDLDGTICEQDYSEVEPIESMVGLMRELKSQGHEIVIHTARHMRTCNGNVGKILAKQGKKLFDCLEKDEVYFGKPHVDVFIDDKAINFDTFDKETLKSRVLERAPNDD